MQPLNGGRVCFLERTCATFEGCQSLGWSERRPLALDESGDRRVGATRGVGAARGGCGARAGGAHARRMDAWSARARALAGAGFAQAGGAPPARLQAASTARGWIPGRCW